MGNEGRAHNRAVDGEIDEFALLHDVDHPFAGHAARHEGGHEAHRERPHPDAGRGGFHPVGHSLGDVEDGFAQDGRHHHEERELGQPGLVVAQEQARHAQEAIASFHGPEAEFLRALALYTVTRVA